ncbi:MAG: histidinol-phosphate transaminase [Betaproteobacteria bacterium]|nr:histidinol-phosphate transaminase [Betaproteobacteria bacterium]
MTLIDRSHPYVRAISPYQPGKPITEVAREIGIPVEGIIKLASNENPLGMSPKARKAVEGAIAGLQRYPDDYDLKHALAVHTGLPMEQIVLGNGSNDILDLIARVFLAPGSSAVCAQYAFAVYPLATMTTGAEIIVVPARDFGHDLDAMRAVLRPDTRLVWIANPNNPTGTLLPHQEVHDFIAALPPDVIVVLDEAYNEYLAPADRAFTGGWLAEFPNLLIIRTFSKIYGLAGLRIGYGIASAEIVGLMNRIRQPFNCNNLALAAAVAALEDYDFLAESFAVNQAGMTKITAALKRLGLDYIPPHGNFITFRLKDARGINEKLLQQGVIVRPLAGYGMPDWLRVTIGTEAENTRFLAALEEALIPNLF